MANLKKQSIVALAIIAASGGGKGTVCKSLIELASLQKNNIFVPSVSDTTKGQKNGDIDGVHYNFISEDEFKERIKRNYYIEWEIYAGNYYGSPRDQLERNIAQGKITLYDVEPNGAEKILIFIGKERMRIYRLVVPEDELLQRVNIRNRDDETTKELRRKEDSIRAAKMEYLGIPLEYGKNVVPGVAANIIYNAIVNESVLQ